jgi:(p)ppGpp synthase/HD superfamily hydrolase
MQNKIDPTEFGISKYLQGAIEYARQCHKDTNHLYDGKPYAVHLTHVAKLAGQFIWYFDEQYHDIILAAAWGHDLIEDTRQTYNDVKQRMGESAADIVFALTNEKGKTRKDRANEKYYTEMKKVPFAVYVKLCDRMANVEHSLATGSSMLNAYKKEHAAFSYMLKDGNYTQMWHELDTALNP